MIFARGLDARRCFMVEHLPLDRFVYLFDYSNDLRFHKHKVKGFNTSKKTQKDSFHIFYSFFSIFTSSFNTFYNIKSNIHIIKNIPIIISKIEELKNIFISLFICTPNESFTVSETTASVPLAVTT